MSFPSLVSGVFRTWTRGVRRKPRGRGSIGEPTRSAACEPSRQLILRHRRPARRASLIADDLHVHRHIEIGLRREELAETHG